MVSITSKSTGSLRVRFYSDESGFKITRRKYHSLNCDFGRGFTKGPFARQKFLFSTARRLGPVCCKLMSEVGGWFRCETER